MYYNTENDLNVVRDHCKSTWSRKIMLMGAHPSDILPSAEQEVMS
jgi:hypothetical protein